MIIITMKIPRQQNKFYYTGDAKNYLNIPITSNEKVIGTITKIISSTDDYIEVEGTLYNAGTNYFVEPDLYPCDVEIR